MRLTFSRKELDLLVASWIAHSLEFPGGDTTSIEKVATGGDGSEEWEVHSFQEESGGAPPLKVV